MKPRDVPDLKADLVRMWAGNLGPIFAAQDLQLSHERADITAKQYAATEVFILKQAEMYWVNDEMCQLLAHARSSLPSTILHEEDVPTPFGLVVLEQPIPGLDIKNPSNDNLSIYAFAWSTVTVLGVHSLRIEFYDDPRRIFGDMPGVRLPTLAFIGASNWTVGLKTEDLSDYGTMGSPSPSAEEHARLSLIEDRKLVQAFFLLLGQRVARVESARLDRQTVRRAQRNGLSEPDVRCVYVRRSEASGEEQGHRDVNWSHRWMVSGHWRRQWYPSQNRHVPIFIAPFVKGPADKELVEKPTVRVVNK